MFARLGRAARQAVKASAAFTARAAPVAASRSLRTFAFGAVASAAGVVAAKQTLSTAECAKMPMEGVPGTNLERTFIAIKPDGVQRGLVNKIIQRFEEKGFQLVAMKMVTPTKEMAEGHYDDLKKKPFFPALTKFFSSGPIIAMVWQGKGVILTGRKLLGETDPAKSPAGSIRGDFSVDMGRNIIHGSDGPEGAAHEIAFWFKESEMNPWQPTNDVWIYEQP